MKTTIITDSASDILIPNKGTVVLPMTIAFGDEQFLDGVNLTHEMFYKRLVESNITPVTSQITPFDYETVLDSALSDGGDALIVTMSAKLSGTYQNACIAAEKYPGRVYVIDSKNISVGERILVNYAESLRGEQTSAKELYEKLIEKVDNVCLFAMLDTLEFLRRGGRISKTAALAGTILSVKPLVSIEGVVVIIGKARGSKQGGAMLNELIKSHGGIDFSLPFALAYSGTSDAQLVKYLEESRDMFGGRPETKTYGTIGGTIGTHAGPGTVAVAFFHN